MSDVEFDYDYLTQRALRRVVHDVLQMTAELGATPGDHHFYIEFQTTAFGVSMPDHLRETYPDKMTIVVQHQFENLTIEEERFGVTLSFKGKQARLVIPFEAVMSFADPSVQFGLRFQDGPEHGADAAAPEAPKPAEPARPKTADGADVVRLDTFRKK